MANYTTEERLAKGQYTDGERWYTSSGYAIRGSEGDYSGIKDKASKEATQAARDEASRQNRIENLEYNLGSNWADIYDLDSGAYKEGKTSADGTGRLSKIANGGEDIGSRYSGGAYGGSSSSGGSYGGDSAWMNQFGDQLDAIKAAMSNRQSGYDEQIAALEAAMKAAREQQQASYNAALVDLDNAVASGQQQAYLNSQKAMNALPQAMAAAGYTGGVTETTASDIMGDYQNALTDLEKNRALTAAQLQMDLDNGILQSDAAYRQQIADLIGQAQDSDAAYQMQIAQLLQQLEQESYNRALTAEEQAWQRRLAEYSQQMDEANLAMKQREADLAAELLNVQIEKARNELYENNNNPALTTTNYNDRGGIAVAGLGRLTQEELAAMIRRGEIETYRNANGTITYRKAG